MTKRTTISAVALFTFSTALLAQFPEVAQHPASIQELTSLSSGIRMIDWPVYGILTAGSRTIYNMDLSVHRVLNFPAPPSGMQWNNMSYITEELFDTDPSTIEFVLVAGPSGMPGDFATFVFREDGTELFSQNPGSFVASLGLTNSFPIFTANGQTYMVVFTTGVYGPPTHIYALPGSLPCMDCRGTPTISGLALDGGTVVDPTSGIAIFPNPAQSEVVVRFGDEGQRADAITIVDGSGREVMRQRITNTASVTLSIDHITPGAYTVIPLSNGQQIGSLPLVITR
ncbi:MAG TPA: T9SS type A sorting domain-containing protein [Flavobacteriales bacterium]|nr:T9SS type A sorting domain-containing protein [Flavobacteriales bacterium]